MIGGVRVLHALMLFGAVPALQQSALEIGPTLAVLVGSGALVREGLVRRADANQVHRVELEFTGRNDVFPAGVRLVLMALAILVFLMGELGITAAELVVRHIAVDLAFMQVLHIRFVGEAGVGGDNRAGFINVVGDAQFFIALLNRLQHRL